MALMRPRAAQPARAAPLPARQAHVLRLQRLPTAAQELGEPGPSGPGHLGGPPAEQALYSRLRSEEDARRIWRISENLTRTAFPTGGPRADLTRDARR
ncbi:hypothetical protein AB0H83_08935 [Dactylosporangium sp. NPDC050688]|uniref:hypothetical protein n=1 Tax=Dactylosporangium sp. NPDC050688 TaxID=3157217 RepID=UPI0033EEEE56